MDDPGFVSQQGQEIFLFIKTRRPTLEPNRSPVVLSQGVKLPRREITTHLYLKLGLRMGGAEPPSTYVFIFLYIGNTAARYLVCVLKFRLWDWIQSLSLKYRLSTWLYCSRSAGRINYACAPGAT